MITFDDRVLIIIILANSIHIVCLLLDVTSMSGNKSLQNCYLFVFLCWIIFQ